MSEPERVLTVAEVRKLAAEFECVLVTRATWDEMIRTAERAQHYRAALLRAAHEIREWRLRERWGVRRATRAIRKALRGG